MKESEDSHTQERYRQYNPHTEEQWAKIKSDWVSYKQDFGLEGEIYLRLTRKEGKSDGDALKLVEEHRKEVEKTREAWYDLRR